MTVFPKNPIYYGIAASIIFSIYLGYLGFWGGEPSKHCGQLWMITLIFSLACWTHYDAGKRGLHRPYELAAFVVMFSYIALPAYLFWSRKITELLGYFILISTMVFGPWIIYVLFNVQTLFEPL